MAPKFFQLTKIKKNIVGGEGKRIFVSQHFAACLKGFLKLFIQSVKRFEHPTCIARVYRKRCKKLQRGLLRWQVSTAVVEHSEKG